jgi:tetratricopeptide (TPR) repeat protein
MPDGRSSIMAASHGFRSCLGALAFAFALLGGFDGARAQTASSDLERCRSIDVPGTSVSLDEAISLCGSIIGKGALSGRTLAEMHVLRGIGLARKNDMDRALADFDQAVRIDPNYARAHNGRGAARSRKNDFDGALVDYNEAIRLEQNFGRAYDNRGLIFRQKKEYERAIADFSEAIRLEPNRAAAYSHRAWTWHLKKDADRALADFDLALRLDPKFAGAVNDRGIVWRDKGDLDRALADFNEAVRLDPKLAIAWVNRGHVFRRKGDFDRALPEFNEAIRINPKLPAAYTGRGYTLFQKKDNEAALADYNKAIELDPKTPFAYNDRGLIWRAKGQPEKAIADYNEAIKLDPNYALPYSNRARAMRANGDIPRAIADFTQALRLDPGFTAAYTDRGLAYEAKGERDRALADFKTALATPQKYENGKWAHDTARARIALLTGTDLPSTQPAARPINNPAPVPNTQVATAPAVPLAPPGSRVALVIGNSAYVAAGALPNPANDARAVAKALRDIGFDVSEGVNLDHRSQEKLVRDFLRKSANSKIALLYYAGHGMQVDGKNYLVPVDARLQAATDLPFETLELDKIIAGLDDESRTNIIILDACRDNPLAKAPGVKSRSAAGSGLAAVSSVGSGTLIAYATAPGAVALDGEGVNSPFTAALVKHIRTPGLEVRQMLTRVRSEVASTTQKKQIPWDNSSLLGEVYLAGAAKR